MQNVITYNNDIFDPTIRIMIFGTPKVSVTRVNRVPVSSQQYHIIDKINLTRVAIDAVIQYGPESRVSDIIISILLNSECCIMQTSCPTGVVDKGYQQKVS